MSRSTQSMDDTLDDDAFLGYLKGLVGKTLHTLDYKMPFTVDGVEKDQINITTSVGKSRAVTRKGTISAHKHLVTIGELSSDEINDQYSDLNCYYIAAILANLDYVDYRLRPIRLSIKMR